MITVSAFFSGVTRPVARAAAATIVCATALAAQAADISTHPIFFDPSAPPASFAPSFPSTPSAPVFVQPPPPVFDWSGLYLGLNAGYVFNGRTSYALTATDALTAAGLQTGSAPSLAGISAGGFTGGGQIGFNKQLDPMLIPPLAKFGVAVVLGVEADAAYTGLSASGTFVPTGESVATTLHSRTEFVGTLRPRIGLAIDRLFVYGTGGFAYGGVDKDATIMGPGAYNFAGSSSGLRVGYAYGGGVAYAFPATPLFKAFKSPAVTVKLEYLHYDFGSSTFMANNTAGLGNAYSVHSHDSGNIVRAGIDYKFDLKIPPPPY